MNGYRPPARTRIGGIAVALPAVLCVAGVLWLGLMPPRHRLHPESAILAYDIAVPAASDHADTQREPVRKPRPHKRTPMLQSAPSPAPESPVPDAVVAPIPVVRTAPPVKTSAVQVQKPAPAPTPAAPVQSTEQRRNAYAALLWQRIAARRPGGIHMPGTATIAFKLNAAGGIVRANVVQGSGNRMLDRLALRTVRRAAPFPKPPQTLDGALDFTIAFHFD
ncbi:hypothetical protein GCM10023219_11220 [Stakelama sediminis]|uniref:Protein TonB n=1 Tax=Stakelama sediminis TaxID=463200 RepID=A0A840YWD9_9SPHN|nr:energy transducer TonB [Stakelama sediminis]MBB5717846.1 protein TonB [Stakelama sediminis]